MVLIFLIVALPKQFERPVALSANEARGPQFADILAHLHKNGIDVESKQFGVLLFYLPSSNIV